MRLIYDAITRVAKGSTTVMIRGESGTGKELVARAIVANSPRAQGLCSAKTPYNAENADFGAQNLATGRQLAITEVRMP